MYKVIIEVRGGIVIAVHADDDVDLEVQVVDWDDARAGTEKERLSACEIMKHTISGMKRVY